MQGSTDGELMDRIRAGDRDAFAHLVDRYKDELVRFLTRLAGSRAQAEDVAQETFVALFRNASKYQESGRLRAYLYRIATNRLRSDARRQARRRLLGWLVPSGDNGGPPPETPQSAALASETQRKVAAALGRLPVHYRAPLLMHTVDGMPYQEVAQLLGCREGTVKSRINRGRRMLKEELAPYFAGEE